MRGKILILLILLFCVSIPISPLTHSKSPRHPAVAYIVCDGKDGFKVVLHRNRIQTCDEVIQCIIEHEEDHVLWFKQNQPNECKGKPKGALANIRAPSQAQADEIARQGECRAYKVSHKCMVRSAELAFANVECLATHIEKSRTVVKSLYQCDPAEE